MKPRCFIISILGAMLFTFIILFLSVGPAVATDGVGSSYLGQMGEGTGMGMPKIQGVIKKAERSQNNL